MPQKLDFSDCQLEKNMSNICAPFYDNTLLPPFTINFLGLSATQNLNLENHITSLAKSAPQVGRSAFLPCQFLSPSQMPSTYKRALSVLVWSVCVCGVGAPHAQLCQTEWNQGLFVSSTLLFLWSVPSQGTTNQARNLCIQMACEEPGCSITMVTGYSQPVGG